MGRVEGGNPWVQGTVSWKIIKRKPKTLSVPYITRPGMSQSSPNILFLINLISPQHTQYCALTLVLHGLPCGLSFFSVSESYSPFKMYVNLSLFSAFSFLPNDNEPFYGLWID